MKKEECVCWKKIKRWFRKIGSWCLRNLFIIISVVVSGIIIIAFHKIKPTEGSSESYLGYIISGILGSILSACIVFYTLTKETKVSKIDAHIELRKLFFEEPRMRVHELLLLYQNLCNIENQDEIHFLENNKVLERLKLGDDEIRIKDNVLKNAEDLKNLKERFESALQKDIANLYDYFGIFEIASKMLDDGILDKKLFMESYKYRLDTIECAFDNMEFLKKQDSKYWTTLYKLIDRFK